MHYFCVITQFNDDVFSRSLILLSNNALKYAFFILREGKYIYKVN